MGSKHCYLRSNLFFLGFFMFPLEAFEHASKKYWTQLTMKGTEAEKLRGQLVYEEKVHFIELQGVPQKMTPCFGGP